MQPPPNTLSVPEANANHNQLSTPATHPGISNEIKLKNHLFYWLIVNFAQLTMKMDNPIVGPTCRNRKGSPMINRAILLTSLAFFGSVAAFGLTAGSASALTMKECSAKYKIAQKDGSAKDMKWNDFRKAQCGADATAEPEVTTASDEEPVKPTVAAPKGVAFPTKVDAKYASESAGKQRMHTCVDSYHANKTANTLNGLKWIQKGGGFYSLCNAKLKGA
jgi:hypothetical protein